jgi:two-component system sensor kinase FixL
VTTQPAHLTGLAPWGERAIVWLSNLRFGSIVAYTALYVFLDWISFVYPFGRLNITPWNPQIGFAFVMLLLGGGRLVPAVLVAPILADLITRPDDMPVPVSITVSLISGSLYALASLTLRNMSIRPELPPQRVRDLAVLLAAAGAAATLVAVFTVMAYVAFGLVLPEAALKAGARLWVGDMIGIVVCVPLGFTLLQRERWHVHSLELVINAALLIAVLVAVVAISHQHQLSYFYVLFVPVVFIAVRLGYEAVVISLATVQVALIAICRFSSMTAVEVTTLQGLLLVLAVTGMTAGILVSEQRRAERALRQQQEVQARLQQFGSLGELTSLIAHEINQPLTAAGTYTRMIVEARASALPEAKIDELAHKAAQQVERAGEVLRRLRDLVRLGRSQQETVAVQQILREAVGLIEQDLDQARPITLRLDIAEGVPPVFADRIQIEQVLLNLVRNAIEVLVESGRDGGLITVSARKAGANFVAFSVEDNGPGIPALQQETLRPLQSRKPHGLGIGLALSRTIVELHRGTFTIDTRAPGGLVRFTLPIGR